MYYLALFFGISFLVIGLIFISEKKKKLKREALHKDYANKNGFKYVGRNQAYTIFNLVDGTVNGLHIQLYEGIVERNKKKRIVTYVTIHNPPINFEFRIGHEGFISQTKRIFGKDDIKLENPYLDKKFLFSSNSEHEFKNLMTYQMQDELKRLEGHLKSSIHNWDDVLIYSVFDGLKDEDALKSIELVIDFMVKLCSQRKR